MKGWREGAQGREATQCSSSLPLQTAHVGTLPVFKYTDVLAFFYPAHHEIWVLAKIHDLFKNAAVSLTGNS